MSDRALRYPAVREVFTAGRAGSAKLPSRWRKVLKSISHDPLTPNTTDE
jgi:hypothetical protein